jgi:hypothetical protein
METTNNEQNGRVITARKAIIKTVSVSIKTLRIGPKQMTMGVFRQLRQKRLLNHDTAEFLGVPWGIVNYHPDCTYRDHLHVVWQEGDQLRTDCVYPVPDIRCGVGRYNQPCTQPVGWWDGKGINRRPVFLFCDQHVRTGSLDNPLPPFDDAARDLFSKWGQQYEALASLDQLFIAV